jgi:hypothetical protein
MTRPSVAAVWRPRRTLLVLFLNGVVVYALILLRLHTVSEGLEEQSRQAFPGAGVDAVVLVQRQEEQSIRSLDKGQDKVRIIPPEPIDRESHSEKLNVLTGREERIEVANTRIFHLAWKADLKDPKQLGLEFKDDHGDGRPAYHEIVDEAGNVTRNVADLLQFAVVGFGKCGTTTLMDWISEHPRCKCFPEEILDLMRSDPAALLAKLYTLPSGDFQRGYKVSRSFATILPALVAPSRSRFVSLTPTLHFCTRVRWISPCRTSHDKSPNYFPKPSLLSAYGIPYDGKIRPFKDSFVNVWCWCCSLFSLVTRICNTFSHIHTITTDVFLSLSFSISGLNHSVSLRGILRFTTTPIVAFPGSVVLRLSYLLF